MRSLNAAVLCLILPASVALAQPAASQPASAPVSQPVTTATDAVEADARLHVLFVTDISGRFAWPGCNEAARANAQQHAHLGHLTAAIEAKKRALAAKGELPPVVLAGGSTIRPDILGPHVFGGDGKLADRAAGLLGRVGFDAMAVGPFDFSTPPNVLRGYLTRMSRLHVPMLASNVSCNDPSDFRCRYLGANKKRYVVLTRGNQRVGVVAITRHDLAARVIKRGRGSLSASDPVAETRALVRTLRTKEKVSAVILLGTLNLERKTPGPTLDLVRALGEDAPDLVIADNMYDRRSADFIARIQSRLRSSVVGTGRFGQHLGHATIHIKHTADGTTVPLIDVDVQPLATQSLTPAAKDTEDAQALIASLCSEVAKPLGGAVVSEPIEHDDFVTYLLEIMRSEQNAEIAMINETSLAPTRLARGKLTREAVERALRSNTHLGSIWITGARLQTLMTPYFLGLKKGLKWIGIEKKGLKWKINKRPLIAGQHYKIATTRFVATGGDELISLRTERFKDSGEPLRRKVIAFFNADRQARVDGNANIDPKSDFSDPWKNWVLYGGSQLGLYASNLSISNGTGSSRYSQPLLTRESVSSLKLDVDLSFGASNHNHALDLDVGIQYGRTWTRTWEEIEQEGETVLEEKTTPAESLDQIRVDLLYSLKLLRTRYGADHWYMPMPFVESTLISEFTKDDKSYRYVDLAGIVGIGLLPHPYLFIKAGFTFAGELDTPKEELLDEEVVRKGIYLGYKLKRLRLISSPMSPLQFESRLDFFMTNLGNSFRKELTLESKLYFSITPYLHLTAAHHLYVFDTSCGEPSCDLSAANDVSFGLEVLFDHRHQIY